MINKKTKEAFVWIITILRKYKVPFRITGGFAANIYGSTRSLADIDIEILNDNILKIERDIKKYIIYGPKRYKDNEFDLFMVTIKYKGQEIDICGSSNQKLFNKKTNKWETEKINLSWATKKKVYDFIVPVIPLKDLIRYKKKIAREVDIQDINFLLRI